MQAIIRSIDVAAPLATAVRRWAGHRGSGQDFVDAIPSFQSLADDKTRVILSAARQGDTSTDIVELVLDHELERFKQAVESGQTPLRGLIDLLRRQLP